MRLIVLTTLMLILPPCCKAQRLVGGCEGCELMFEGMPNELTSSVRIADASGEPLTISGIVYKTDGLSPAPGVILYVYHTNEKGLYAATPGQQHARRHGHLRAWMKTDQQGRYEFTTIRPGAYPSNRAAQHIHPIILEPDGRYYWIDEYLFDDDPLLTERERKSQEGRGGGGIIHLTKDKQGRWIGHRDLILGKNVPGY